MSTHEIRWSVISAWVVVLMTGLTLLAPHVTALEIVVLALAGLAPIVMVQVLVPEMPMTAAEVVREAGSRR